MFRRSPVDSRGSNTVTRETRLRPPSRIKEITSSLNSIASFNSASYTINPDKAHRIDSIDSGTVTPVSYDDNGNITSIGTLQLSVDYDNMLSSANNDAVIFTYDGAGKRVKKQTGGTTKTYIGDMFECINKTNCGVYIFAAGSRVGLKHGENIYYYHPDHLGSTAMITDKGGEFVEGFSYDPFGAADSSAESVYTHKYNSQEQDSETGFYNYQARYYNPDIGRFVSPDTIVPDLANPQSLNRYSYVLNNPMNMIDPTGHESITAFTASEGDTVYGGALYLGSPPADSQTAEQGSSIYTASFDAAFAAVGSWFTSDGSGNESSAVSADSSYSTAAINGGQANSGDSTGGGSPLGSLSGSMNSFLGSSAGSVGHFASGLTLNTAIGLGTSILGLVNNYQSLPTTPQAAGMWGVDLIVNKTSLISGLLPSSNSKAYAELALGVAGIGTAILGSSPTMTFLAGYGLGNAINSMPVGNSNFQNFWSDTIWKWSH